MPVLVILLALLIAIGFIAVLLAIARRGAAHSIVDGQTTLRHSALLRWFSILAVFGGNSALAIVLVLLPPQDPIMAWGMTLGIAALGLLGMALLWESFRWMLLFDATGLKCQSPWKKPREAVWQDVKSIRYSRVQSWYVIRFADASSFRVPAIVPGVATWLAEASRHGVDVTCN